ncbi:GGDEF domain-containing protein [Methylobacterium sp. E-065]|uniref:GGDEF domain-containing protein n=1 Tax=Methylobacterium sp. E-065 TaxID=2836583 RepID=UPI001FBBDA81|nr:GGDEF domain-containing protein [Methylobacterium sp. E-065]MCJ2021804.1 GGDEF domain-containing protein [Methylobacterium sp. E-065]
MAAGMGPGRSDDWFDGWSRRSTWLALAVSALALVGLDHAFPAVGMGPAYIPLIALAGWRLGPVAACAVAGVAAFFNIYLHGADGEVPTAVAAARGALRLGTYAFVVALMHALRRSFDRERTAARRDYLTGALVRGAFDGRVAALSASVAHGHGALALVLVDVDGFKGVNDGHGHAAGDDTLRILVRSAAASLRPEDCLGRLGGDEFAAALVAGSVEEARRRVATFHRIVSEGLACAGVPVTVSMGASILMPGEWTDTEAAMREADRAMYDAKAAGPGGVRIHAGQATCVPPVSAASSMVPAAA